VKAEDLQLGRVWYPPPVGLTRWPHPSRWTQALWWHWCQHGLRPMSADEFAQYWIDRQRWGFGLQALDRRGQPVGDITWLYNPGPRAIPFHAAEETNVLYGGARGGMKSHSLRWEFHRRCMQVPGYRAILFRRLHEELKLYHVDRSRREIKAITNNHPEGRVVGDDECLYPNGSLLKFGHCKDAGDEEKYLGSEWDAIGFDQMETFLPSQIVDIMGSGRSAGEGISSIVRGTANPGGVAPQWIIDHFLTKQPQDDDKLAYDPADWRYIPARVYDNPYLMDADGSFLKYEARLARYGEVRRRQMLLGDWAAREGQFFPELLEAKHQTVRDVPPGTRWYGGLDYGFNRPGCINLWACLPDGRMYCRHDLKFRGRALFAAPQAHGETKAAYDARAQETVAHQLKTLCEREGIRLYQLLCDPDLDAQKTGGETPIQGLRRVGIPAIAADNNRYLGWLRCRAWFATAPDGQPWAQFHPDAAYTWRSLTGVVSDKTNAEDVDTDGDDHGADACRYVLFSRPSPDGRQAARTKFAKGSIGAMIRKSQGTKGHARRII
jgi:phage terminase large subunit